MTTTKPTKKEIRANKYREQVIKLFNGNLQGFYINTDPRGCALKINDREFNALYKETKLEQDWGGNGMLSPTID